MIVNGPKIGGVVRALRGMGGRKENGKAPYDVNA